MLLCFHIGVSTMLDKFVENKKCGKKQSASIYASFGHFLF